MNASEQMDQDDNRFKEAVAKIRESLTRAAREIDEIVRASADRAQPKTP